MTIQEAIKSGKKFKRPGWTTWCEPSHKCVFDKRKGRLHDKQMRFVTKEDLLAEDWIIHDLKSSLLAALKQVLAEHDAQDTHRLIAMANRTNDTLFFRVQSEQSIKEMRARRAQFIRGRMRGPRR